MKYAIDTNIFFSFQKGINLGAGPFEVMDALEGAIQRKGAEFCMPPEIAEELLTMFEKKDLARAQQFLARITVQSPQLSRMTIPASVFAQYISEGRRRSLDGLHVAEEILEKTTQSSMGQPPQSRMEWQKSLQQPKETMRARYRNATRTGYLDSLADLQLILLAVEQGATLVTEDEGVRTWGRLLGAAEMTGAVFGKSITQAV
jgi:RNA ligase partner protein